MRYALFSLITLSLTSMARATDDSEWLLCSSCTSATQFAGMAIAQTGGFTGDFDYYIGNPDTGEIHHVRVIASRGGGVPAVAGSVTEASGHVAGLASSPGMQYDILLNKRLNAIAETQFREIAAAARKYVTVPDNGRPYVLPDNPAFASFGGRNQTALRDYFWQNGAKLLFEQRADSDLFTMTLTEAINALTSSFNPVVNCYIFNNGDIGCFEWAMTAQDSANPVAGTAKDKDGRPIDGGNGAGGYGVHTDSGGAYYGPVDYAPPGGDFWLFCTFVGGKVSSCSVKWVPK